MDIGRVYRYIREAVRVSYIACIVLLIVIGGLVIANGVIAINIMVHYGNVTAIVLRLNNTVFGFHGNNTIVLSANDIAGLVFVSVMVSVLVIYLGIIGVDMLKNLHEGRIDVGERRGLAYGLVSFILSALIPISLIIIDIPYFIITKSVILARAFTTLLLIYLALYLVFGIGNTTLSILEQKLEQKGGET